MEFIVTELEGRERTDVFNSERCLGKSKFTQATNIGTYAIDAALQKIGVSVQKVTTPYGIAKAIPLEAIPALFQALGERRGQSGRLLYPWAADFADQICTTGKGEIEIPCPRTGGTRRRITYRSATLQ